MFGHVTHLLTAERNKTQLKISSKSSTFSQSQCLRHDFCYMISPATGETQKSRYVPFLKYDVLKMNEICCMLNTAVLSSLNHLDGVSIEKMIMHFMTRRG